jgi:hypothetical protein
MAIGNSNLMGHAMKPLSKTGPARGVARSSLLWNQIKLYATSQQPADLYPDLPTSGSAESIQAYASTRSLPVFRFVDLPVDQGLVVFSMLSANGVVPIFAAFLYVDQSMAAQSWYCTYRYLSNGFYGPPLPTTGPIPGASGAMTLIASNPSSSLSAFWLDIASPFTLPAPFLKQDGPIPPNPNLVLLTGGMVPALVTDVSMLEYLTYL